MMTVRKELKPLVDKNKAERQTQDAYEGWYNAGEYADISRQNKNFLQKIIDIREYDLTYQIRVQIDNEIRVSFWYNVHLEGPMMKSLTPLRDKLDKAALRVLAFDIETTK
jgi:DNA polymerase epsilon subunit 1